VEREHARRIAESVDAARVALEEIVDQLTVRVSQSAGDLCASYLTDSLVQLGLRVLLPLWEEHPELHPEDKPAIGGPRHPWPSLPPAEAERILAGIDRLRTSLLEAIPLAGAGASTPGESIGYRAALVHIADTLQVAQSQIKGLAGK
jgi:hypothetical protein